MKREILGEEWGLPPMTRLKFYVEAANYNFSTVCVN